MRILYGAFAQGQGHFSKAAVLIPLLEARGHQVRLISSGGKEPPSGYSFRWHRHFPALSYVISKGKTDYKKTVAKWAKEVPTVFKHLWKLRRLVKEYEPDLIISDFEPLTASPFLEPSCEVIAISRQVALFDRAIPLPDGMNWDRKLARTVIRLFTAGADRLFGYHYEPLSFRSVPPIIRTELQELTPTLDGPYFVYNHYHTEDSGKAEHLIQWAKKQNQEVIAYGFPEIKRGKNGLVDFRPAHREKFFTDMSQAKGVITTAGLTTPLEAFLLNKPVVSVPIPNQWEQLVNAFHLDNAGIAKWSEEWDYDQLLERPAPEAEHHLTNWLNTTADEVLDKILHDQGTDQSKTQSERPASAA